MAAKHSPNINNANSAFQRTHTRTHTHMCALTDRIVIHKTVFHMHIFLQTRKHGGKKC